jgi:aminopeptidase N
MGYLLDTGKTGESSHAVTYGKGGYILHMLRMLMREPEEGDVRFLAMLKDLVTTYANGFLSTQDFKVHVEKHMTPKMDLHGDNKMDWFFDQWVYGTQLPSYSLDYKISQGKDGKYRAQLKVRQSQVSDDFVMLVPVYGQFGKNTVRICQVRMEGNTESQPLTIPLPEKPKKLLLCAQHDILCDVK